jgi:hypothetical protein
LITRLEHCCLNPIQRLKMDHKEINLDGLAESISMWQEPELRGRLDWNAVKGDEYLIIEKIIENVDILKQG